MLRRTLLTACAASLLAGAAFGQELDDIGGDESTVENSNFQVIVITPNGFFPQITYVAEGEQIKFYNQAEASRTIVAVTDLDGDGVDDMEEPQWALSSMPHGSYHTLHVSSAMVLDFETIEGTELVASFSFEEPPAELMGDAIVDDGSL
jgi:plastocyanin